MTLAFSRYAHHIKSAVQCLAAIALVMAAGSLKAAEVTAVWDVPTGLWSTASNWDINQVPDNDLATSYVVLINNNLVVPSTATLDLDVTINGLTIDADDALLHERGWTLAIDAQGVIHDGRWFIDSSTTETSSLRFLQADTLQGDGTIFMTGPNAEIVTDGGLLTILDNTMTIRGSGRILDGVGGANNSALILADQADPMAIHPAPGSAFVNLADGQIQATGPAGIDILNSGDFLNSGAVAIATGSQIDADLNYIQDAGTTFIDYASTLTVAGSALITGGVLYGSGTVIGNLSALGGTIQPGNAGPGILNVLGIYTQNAISTLDIDISGITPGTEYDVLNVEGIANLDGILNVTFTTPPPDGAFYTILNCTFRFGAHPTINLTGLAVTQSATVFFNSDNVSILISGGAPPPTPTPTPTPPPTPVDIDFSARQESYRISDNTKNVGRLGPVAIGDVNGDGFGDWVMGAPRSAFNGVDDTGAVYVRFGYNFGGGIGEFPETFFDLTVHNPLITNPTLTSVLFPDAAGRPFGGVQINAELDGRLFGDSVASGDFDGDGIMDIAIGCTDRLGTFGPIGPGRVYIIRGYSGIGGLTSPQLERLFSRSILIEGRNTGDRFGEVLAFGDINFDGRDDLIIGSPNAGNGTVDVVYGRSFTQFSVASIDAVPSPHTQIIGPHAGSMFGFSLATGELNGVVGEELLIGAPYYDEFATDAGAVFVYVGGMASFGSSLVNFSILSNDPVVSSPGFIFNHTAGDTMGYSITTGDFDSGGVTDLAIGAPFANREQFSVPPRSGAVFVKYMEDLFNPANSFINMTLDTDLLVVGAEANGKFGNAVVSGDFNADGRDDLVIGAYDNAAINRVLAGMTFLLMGREPAERLEGGIVIGELVDGYSRADVTLMGDRAGDFGATWLAVGDVDDDGFDDIMVSGNRSGGVNDNSGSTWTSFGVDFWNALPKTTFAVVFETNVTAADPQQWNLYE